MQERKQIITLMLFAFFLYIDMALKNVELRWLDLFLLFFVCFRTGAIVEKLK